MSEPEANATPKPGALYSRQLLGGRDFVVGNHLAFQMSNYVYAVGDTQSREAILVDPAYAPDELLALLEADDMQLVGVALSHFHADHAGGELFGRDIPGVAALLERVDVPVHVQRAELEWVTRSTGLPATSFRSHDPGDTLVVGGHAFTLIHTPGHTPGSQCLLVGNQLVSGDTLFLDSCGRTDLPGGDADALYDSLQHVLAELDGSTRVLPGHAYSPQPSATLGELRELNPVLRPLDRAAWRAAFT